jgi:hypothetical protein
VKPLFSRYDHIMATTSDVAGLQTALSGQGFTMSSRRDAGPPPAVQQCLVAFADDSYLEYVVMGRGDEAARANRYWPLFTQGVAIVDYSVATASASDVAHRAHVHDVPFTRLRVSRERHDGALWDLDVTTLGRSVGSPLLPFAVENVSDPGIRLPTGAARVHANGARGIAGLTFVTADPASAAAVLAPFYGEPEQLAGIGEAGPGICVRFAGRWLAVVGPQAPAAAAYLRAHGPGLLEVTLARTHPVHPGEGDLLDPASMLGARIRIGR